MVQTLYRFIPLHCVAEDWSYKLLVGTYIDGRMYPEALAALDRIPDTPQGNADFKAIYYAYIELLTGGSGKNSDAAFVLQQSSLKQKDTQQILAESMLALLYGDDYVRSVKGSSSHNLDFKSKSPLILAPNPANNNVTVYWNNFVVDATDLHLTDLSGRPLKVYKNIQNGFQISIDNLPNGVYFVYAVSLSTTQKLVVIH